MNDNEILSLLIWGLKEEIKKGPGNILNIDRFRVLKQHGYKGRNHTKDMKDAIDLKLLSICPYTFKELCDREKISRHIKNVRCNQRQTDVYYDEIDTINIKLVEIVSSVTIIN